MNGLYYCTECERVFEEEEIITKDEYLAEAWGRPIYETRQHCPICGEYVGEYTPPYDEDEEEEEDE